MHGNLRTLVGGADYALYVGDPVLFSRVDAIYRYVRSQATRFGFLPEVIGRQGDIVATETCALMDYIGLAVTLANHGHPEYWCDVERVVRNQLIENQAHNLTWLKGALNGRTRSNSLGAISPGGWRVAGPDGVRRLTCWPLAKRLGTTGESRNCITRHARSRIAVAARAFTPYSSLGRT